MLTVPGISTAGTELDGFNFDIANDPRRQTLIARQKSIQDNMSFVEGAAAAVPAVFASIVDTFGTSLHVLDDGDVKNFLDQTLPNVSTFYSAHEQGLHAIGDIVSSFLPAAVAIKAVRTGGVFARFAERALGANSKLLPYITSTGLSNASLAEEAIRTSKIVDTVNKGVRRLDQTNTAYRTLRRATALRSFKDIVVEGVAADLAIAASMNQSDFLFPDEMSVVDNLALFGTVNLLFGAGSGIAAKSMFNRTANRVFGGLAKRAQNPGKVPIGEVGSAVDRRGIEITAFTSKLADVLEDQKGAVASGDRELSQTLLTEQNAIQDALKDRFVKLAKDSPIDGVTSNIRYSFDSPQVQTLQAVAENDYQAFFGIRSIENYIDDAGKYFDEALKAKDAAQNGELERVVEKAKKAGPGAKREKLIAKAQDLQEQILDNKRTVPLVAEIDGTVTPAIGRKGIFQDGPRKIVSDIDGISRATVKENGFYGSADLNGSISFNTPRIEKQVFETLDQDSSNLNAWVKRNVDKKLDLQFSVGFNRDFKDIINNAHTKQDIIDGLLALPAKYTLETPEFMQAHTRYTLGAIKKIVNGLQNSNKEIQNTLMDSMLPFGTKEFEQLNLFERSTIYDLLQKSIERVNPTTMRNIVINDDAHYTQLDYVLELLDGPNFEAILPKIKATTTDPRDLMFRSLAGKYDDFQKLVMADAKLHGAGKFEEMVGPKAIMKMLNLPEDDLHPIRELFTMLVDNKHVSSFTDYFKNMDSVEEGLRTLLKIAPEEPIQTGANLRGNMMKLSRSRKPVVMLSRNVDPGIDTIDREVLMRESIELRTKMNNVLLDSKDSVFAKGIAETVQENAPIVQAMKEKLKEVIGGLEPSGKFLSAVTQRNFRLRDVPGFSEADSLSDVLQKKTEKAIEAVLNSPIGSNPNLSIRESFNQLLRAESQGDKVSFFTFRTALGKGWDTYRKPSSVGDGLFQFALKKTERNRALWKQIFKEEMPADAKLPVTGDRAIPVTLTQKALDAANGMNQMSQQLLNEVNTIRKARNLPPIARKDFHLPPPNFEGKELVYLVDNAGRVRSVVGASTREQAERLAKNEAELSLEPLNAITKDSMQQYHNARMKAFFEMDDFSNPIRQTGQAKGTAFGSEIQIGDNVFRDMLEQLTKGFVDVDRQTRGLMFEPEIEFLKLQKGAAGLGRTRGGNIFDEMIGTIVGVKDINPNSIPTKSLKAMEDAYDGIMKRIFDSKFSEALPDNPIELARRKREYNQFEKTMTAQFNPFDDFNDFLTKTARVELPQELRKHAGLLNEIVTAATIRIMDVGMALVNMMSLATTVPPVLKSIARRAGETEAEHISRIGAWGTTTAGGVVKVSPSRSLASGVHFMFSEQGQKFMQEAAKRGFFDQFAAEQVEIFARTGEKFLPGVVRDATKALSIFTDKSERLARAISFMTFADMGKRALGLSDNAAMVFAHKQANNVIADFRPINRPLIFQGAAGMPFGLFTTFMWNFLQRIYRNVENAQMGALINQVGLQAMLFGAETLPGADLVLNHLGNNYDGSENLADRLNKNFGQDVTEYLMNGSVSALSGISFGPRIAVGLPLQAGVGPDSIPAVRLAKRVFETAGKMVDSIAAEQGIDVNHMAQILAASNLNKGLSNIIEIYQGRATDLNDNIIEAEVRNSIGISSRVLGFKPLYADELRQENRRQRITETHRAALRERMGEALRSQIRQGTLDQEAVDRALGDYIMAGGNAESFKRYFNSQVVKASSSKLDLEIVKAIKENNDQNRMARLLFLSDR